jgi:hypothetical protein
MGEIDSSPVLKPIENFRGYYASECGWIWSTWKMGKGYIWAPDAKQPMRLACPINKRKGKSIEQCYRVVTLVDGEKKYFGQIHRLIIRAFKGPPPEEKYQAAHDNGNPQDNRIENLIWKSPLENIRDKYRHGRIGHVFGEQLNHKLTEEQVLEIRRRYAAGGVQQWRLAKEFGLHQVTVSEIVTRKIWPHI